MKVVCRPVDLDHVSVGIVEIPIEIWFPPSRMVERNQGLLGATRSVHDAINTDSR
jgi:hypothetical protein